MDRTVLNEGIRQFYDASSGLWEDVWGEHMHHGYYEPGSENKDRRLAQVDLIERLLEWAAVDRAEVILDVGCGIGGSSLFLAKRFDADVTGITLSPVQCARAIERAQEQGLSEQTHFAVADALSMPFADAQFDLVWSLESGEHMVDKQQFLAECERVLKPGGKLIVVTWCCRDGELSAREQTWLEVIYRVYHLPYIISIAAYEQLLIKLDFEAIQSADWSRRVARFWSVVIESALDPWVLVRVLAQGPSMITGALAMQLMRRGYERGLLQFGVLAARKPDASK